MKSGPCHAEEAIAAQSPAPAAALTAAERLRLRALKFGNVLPPTAVPAPAAGAAASDRGRTGADLGNPPGHHSSTSQRDRRHRPEGQPRQQLQRQDSAREQRPHKSRHSPHRHAVRPDAADEARPAPGHSRSHTAAGNLRGNGRQPSSGPSLMAAVVLDAPLAAGRREQGGQHRPPRQQPDPRYTSRRSEDRSQHGASGEAAPKAGRLVEITARPAEQAGKPAMVWPTAPAAGSKQRKGRGFSDIGSHRQACPLLQAGDAARYSARAAAIEGDALFLGHCTVCIGSCKLVYNTTGRMCILSSQSQMEHSRLHVLAQQGPAHAVRGGGGARPAAELQRQQRSGRRSGSPFALVELSGPRDPSHRR